MRNIDIMVFVVVLVLGCSAGEYVYKNDRSHIRYVLSEDVSTFEDREPVLIYRPSSYTIPRSQQRNISGTVLLEFTINETGIPENIIVIESDNPNLVLAAVGSVSEKRYLPAIENGQRVPFTIQMERRIRLH